MDCGCDMSYREPRITVEGTEKKGGAGKRRGRENKKGMDRGQVDSCMESCLLKPAVDI